MTTDFQIAGGTVIGREHVTIGRNNQDAFCWSSTPDATVAVVADGCGSGVHSEVGAQIGARLLTEALRVWAPRLDREEPVSALERLRLDLLAQLRLLAEGMGGSFNQVVGEYFLFTLLGFVIGARWTTIFGIGDGVFVLNGQRRVLVAPDNAPPYAGYGLLGVEGGGPRFEVHAVLATPDLRSLLVGTDGTGEIPDLDELWTDDRYYANPYNVGRRLVQWNRAHRPGLLPDDTTLVVARHAGR
jgi:Protein phosphatase 2C